MNTDQTIRAAAYAIWEAEGRPHGRDAEHWRLAEERLATTSPGEIAAPPPPAQRKPRATAPRARTATKPAGGKATGSKTTGSKAGAKPEA